MIYPLDCYLHSAKCSTYDGPAYYNGAQCLPYHTYCLLYTSPSPRDLSTSRMPSSA